MVIHPSARKHGVADRSIRHALTHPVTEVELSEGRWLVIGPDQAANLFEVIVLLADDGTEVVIHALPLTDQFKRFLP